MLRRARMAEYEESSLRELPETWRRVAFERNGRYRLRGELRRSVTVGAHDLRRAPPDGPLDLVVCRNVAFTYFDVDLQLEVAAKLAVRLNVNGALVIGAHETLPEGARGFVPWSASLRVCRAVG